MQVWFGLLARGGGVLLPGGHHPPQGGPLQGIHLHTKKHFVAEALVPVFRIRICYRYYADVDPGHGPYFSPSGVEGTRKRQAILTNNSIIRV